MIRNTLQAVLFPLKKQAIRPWIRVDSLAAYMQTWHLTIKRLYFFVFKLENKKFQQANTAALLHMLQMNLLNRQRTVRVTVS